MIKIIRTLLAPVFFLITFQLAAQADYGTAIGVRVSPGSGLTIKHFMNNQGAVEGLFTTRWQGFLITVLYEYHQPAFGTDMVNFYYGIGGHAGLWNTVPEGHPWFARGVNDVYVAGMDAIIGLEMTFEEIPFNISLDWKPLFNLGDYTGFLMDEIAFSVRFTL